MTSPETSAPMVWQADPATSLAARYAAAGLLALAAMLFLGGGSTALQDVLSQATSHTSALDGDLARVAALDAVDGGLDDEVADAVDSARAATQAAESALADVGDAGADETRTALALSDAQVALEAAAAQVRHVRDKVEGTVGDALAAVQEHLDALRLPLSD